MKLLKLSCLIAVAAALSGCGLFVEAIHGSGTLITRTEEVDPFTALTLANACSAEVICGPAYSVQVTIDDNLEEYLEVIQNNAALTLRLESGRSYSNCTFRVAITMPDLDSLSLANATAAEVSGFTLAHDLALSADNACHLTLTSMEAAAVTINAADACDVDGDLTAAGLTAGLANSCSADLSGGADALDLTVANACAAEMALFGADNVTVAVRNACSARVWANVTLGGSVTNASSLRYAGAPLNTVTHDISSSVSHL